MSTGDKPLRISREAFVEPGSSLFAEQPLLFVTLGSRSSCGPSGGHLPKTCGMVIAVCFVAISACAFIAFAGASL
jgi:hypothetical protein